jgi:hypothetical protein
MQLQMVHACMCWFNWGCWSCYIHGFRTRMVTTSSCINVLGTMVNIPCTWVKWKGGMTRWKHAMVVHFAHYFGGIFSLISSSILSSKYKMNFWHKTSNTLFVTFHMTMFFQQTFIYSHIYACFNDNLHLDFSHEITSVELFI